MICQKIIKEIRKKGWTQAVFATKWGRKPSWVSNILNGKVDFSVSTLAEIEEILGIELLNKD